MTLKLIRLMFWHSWCWLLRMDLFQPSFVFLELRLILTRSASCLFCLTHIDLNSPARSGSDLSFKLPSLALIELVFFCLLIFHTFTCTDMFWWQCDMMYGAVSLCKICGLIGRDCAGDDPCDQSGNGDVLGNVTLESDGNHGESQPPNFEMFAPL